MVGGSPLLCFRTADVCPCGIKILPRRRASLNKPFKTFCLTAGSIQINIRGLHLRSGLGRLKSEWLRVEFCKNLTLRDPIADVCS
ncbi:hypothetical protein ATE67_09620 [Sphingopyxis sp. H050]|nr:hypothetical protein ATE67_09620 [Sphingopyxis sp. H050]